jgi:hypothetical protein
VTARVIVRPRSASEINAPYSSRRHLKIGVTVTNLLVLQAHIGALLTADYREGQGHRLLRPLLPLSVRDLKQRRQGRPAGLKKVFGRWLNHDEALTRICGTMPKSLYFAR